MRALFVSYHFHFFENGMFRNDFSNSIIEIEESKITEEVLEDVTHRIELLLAKKHRISSVSCEILNFRSCDLEGTDG